MYINNDLVENVRYPFDSRILSKKIQLFCIWYSRAVFAGMFSSLILFAHLGQAQTLDEVVNQQLKVGPIKPCEALLGSDRAINVLIGPLAGRTLCGRSIGENEQFSSAATGGGAATTTSLPVILQKRLKTNDGKEMGGGGSADIISNLGNGWNIFLSGEYQSLNRDLTSFEDGYNSNIGAFSGGIDKQITEQLLTGVAFNYSHQSGNFLSAGDFNNNSYGGLAYAAYTPLENLFIQMNAGYAFRDFERNRFASFTEINQSSALTSLPVTGIANGDYNGDDYNAGILVGYDMNFDSLTIGPRASFNWVRNDYNSYSESGNSGLELRFNDDYRTSLQSSFGVFGSYALSTSIGVIVPQAGVNWIHEFANNQRDITFSFVGDTRSKTFTFQNERPDRDFLEINAGSSIVLPHGFQAFVNYRGIAGHSYFNGHGVNAGLRLEF